MIDRLTNRSAEEIEKLWETHAEDLTFNELIALAGQRLKAKQGVAVKAQEKGSVDEIDTNALDAARDLALAHTALEDAATRYNSAAYRLEEVWKRADPDGRVGQG